MYELPFTPENVDKLYYGHEAGINGNQMIGVNSNDTKGLVILHVVDERTGRKVVVNWSDPKTTLNLFKTKDFYYLINGDYIPEPVKRDM